MSAQLTNLQQLYVRLDLGGFLGQAFDGFNQLIAFGSEYLKPWAMNIHDDDIEPDDGVIRKTNKWFFHFSPKWEERMRQICPTIEEHEELVTACREIFYRTLAVGRLVCQTYDAALPGCGFDNKILFHGSKLRILAYDCDTPLLAEPHVDKGLALHLGQRPNDQALWLYRGDVAEPYQPQAGTALATAGSQVEIISGGILPAVGHYAEITRPCHRNVGVFLLRLDCGRTPAEIKQFASERSRHFQRLYAEQNS